MTDASLQDFTWQSRPSTWLHVCFAALSNAGGGGLQPRPSRTTLPIQDAEIASCYS
jgi:hypothetical protein